MNYNPACSASLSKRQVQHQGQGPRSGSWRCKVRSTRSELSSPVARDSCTCWGQGPVLGSGWSTRENEVRPVPLRPHRFCAKRSRVAAASHLKRSLQAARAGRGGTPPTFHPSISSLPAPGPRPHLCAFPSSFGHTHDSDPLRLETEDSLPATC